MIESVTIHNFQSHKKSTLKFHEGINAITGITDGGKSSVIRSIRLAAQNKPRGEGYRSDWGGDTEVIVNVTNKENLVEITRCKGDNKNEYRIKGIEDPYEALHTDVPEEIQNILNIAEVNIQSQHDSYFLLTETAGQVAKQFNKLAGLEVMDKMIKLVNSKIKEINAEEIESKKKLKETNEKIESLDWIDGAQEQVTELDGLSADMDSIQTTCNTIVDILTNVAGLQKQLDEYEDMSEIEKEADDLLQMIAEINTLENQYDNIDTFITNIESSQKNIERCTKEWNVATKEYDKLLKELGLCPFCGGKI